VVSLTVTPVDDAPLASGTAKVTEEDTPVDVHLPASDVDSPSLTYHIVDVPQHGMLGPAGSDITYTPDPDFHGVDTFTFKVNDGTSDSTTETATMIVTPVNDAPVADNDSYETPEDTPLVVPGPGVLANDDDVDGPSESATLLDAPDHGDLSLNADGSFTYTPAVNYAGPDSFSYQVSDGDGGTDMAAVMLTVTAVNDAPVAEDGSASTQEDTDVTVLLLASDTDSAALSYLIVDAPDHGSLTQSANSITYHPAPDYSGPDSFSFRADDGALNSNVATVGLTVTPVNDAPTIAGVTDLTGPVGSPLGLTVVGADVETAAVDLDVEASGLPAGATFSPATGVFAWTPDTPGSYPVMFTVRDSGGLTASATSMITVLDGDNSPPVCSMARPSVADIWPPNGRMVDVAILGITDPDGETVAIRVTSISVNESAPPGDMSGVGTSQAKLRAARSGTSRDGRIYTVRFTASDGAGGSCDGQVVVAVPHDQGRRRN